jgi:hypothetical protein
MLVTVLTLLVYGIILYSQPKIKLYIHNRCSDFNLINQERHGINVLWHRLPGLEVDAGGMTNSSLLTYRSTFGGAIVYELQRKHIEYDNQPESIYIWLFMAWKSEGYKKLCVSVQLIECEKTFRWSKGDLKRYYQRYVNQFSTYTGSIEDTWLIHDSSVLMTRLELDFTQRDSVLNITISGGVMCDHIKRAKWVDPEM